MQMNYLCLYFVKYTLIFKLFCKYLNKEALLGLGDFKTRHVIRTVKHVHARVLLAKEEAALQYMSDRLIAIGRKRGMEMHVGGTKVMRILRQPSPVQIITYKTT